MYPEVQEMDGDGDREAYLRELHAAYLFKDLLEMGGIRHGRKMVDLLRLLAYQVGSEVSHQELGTRLGMSKDTVAAYIDLLEKAFIIFRVQGFSRNLRNEVSRHGKIYFHDLGVRNVAIGDFTPFPSRRDQGALWENFLVSERRKWAPQGVEGHFWRLHSGAEVDYVEREGASLRAFEFKLAPGNKARVPAKWAETYPEAPWRLIDRGNFLSFILPEGG